MPSLREELCYSSASLVDEVNEVRRHNKMQGSTEGFIKGEERGEENKDNINKKPGRKEREA